MLQDQGTALVKDLQLSQEVLDEVDRRLKASPSENAGEILKQIVGEHDSLKYHLLGPSLTKAGQDAVDQQKVRTQSIDSISLLKTSRCLRLSTMLRKAQNSSTMRKQRTKCSHKRSRGF